MISWPTHVCGDIQKHLQLWAARNLGLLVNDFLQITLQQLATLVDELAGQVPRDLLGREEVLVQPILLHQLHKGQGWHGTG